MDKRDLYSSEKLVEVYEKNRFSGRSGGFVNQKELSIIYEFIRRTVTNKPVILDAPCGTGRLNRFLNGSDINTIGLDYSEAMINKLKSNGNNRIIRSDFFNMSIKNNCLDYLVSLRFFFHYKHIEPIILEIRRVLKDGGISIFDTFNWSPRANNMFKDKRVFIHTKKNVRHFLERMGMEIIDEHHCFFVSPMLYRISPLSLVKVLDLLEKGSPSWLLVRSFWCAKKHG